MKSVREADIGQPTQNVSDDLRSLIHYTLSMGRLKVLKILKNRYDKDLRTHKMGTITKPHWERKVSVFLYTFFIIKIRNIM